MSGKLFTISDPHKGHHSMAMKRGFNSLAEHDEYIVQQWNSVVDKRDTVYILGDITMEKNDYKFLDRLKGFKKIVLGNHDQLQHVRSLLEHSNSVCGCIKLKGFIFTHIPIHPDQLERFYANVHGHVHDKTLRDNRYFNVSAEVLDFKPIQISEIDRIIRRRRSNWFKRFINDYISSKF